MAPALDRSSVEEIYALLRASKWSAAAALYEGEQRHEGNRNPEFRLAYAIALLRSAREAKAFPLLDAEVLALPGARNLLRRFVVSELVASGSLDVVVKILDLLLEASPASVEDRRLRGSLHGRLKQWDKAIADVRRVARERSDDLAAQRSLVQTLLQAGLLDEAGAQAAALGQGAADDADLAKIALLALTRSGRVDEATQLALAMAESETMDEASAAAIVRALVEAGSDENAIQIGERLIEEGWEHEVLRSNVAQAYLSSHREDRYERAIGHLREGLEMAPADARMNMAMGEALLRTRNYDAALAYLQTACELQPKVAQQRMLYARALKQVGRYAEAAREYRTLLQLQPTSPRWGRYAAGALSQAGNRKEAASLFDNFVAERRAALPRNFEQGLKALWDRVDSVHIPQARLDWAWSLSNSRPNDRDDWERRARWGHLADHYLLDWLECRDDRVQDAMKRLADLSNAERALASIDRSKGLILASAHIGAMYAGPLALELLNIRSRWLASTPSVARTAYAGSLISTSDQDDIQVAREFMRSLRQGYAVVVALDGAINLAAPRIQFEGQEITYSSFAARTAHRLGSPSMFCAPRWEDGKIGFVLERMPDPEEGEEADSFAERWRLAFLDSLRRFLGGEPESLRLSGGIWRHIR